jgi:Flp pilus assembly protein TadD
MLPVALQLHEASGMVRAGRCDEALPLLVAITREDLANYPALDLAGICLLQQGRAESALNAFRRAASLHPHAAEPLVNAGQALLVLDRPDEARIVYQRAFDLDPAAPPVAANLSRLLRVAGDREGARRVVDAAIEAGSHHPGVYRERAVDRALRGDREGALGDLLLALERDPESVDLLQLAARTAFELERFAQAAELLERVVALEPDRRDVWATLAGLYAEKLGEPEKAARASVRAGKP